MKIEEVPVSQAIKAKKRRWTKSKYSPIYEKVKDLEYGFAISVICADVKEMRAASQAVTRGVEILESKTFDVWTVGSERTIYIARKNKRINVKLGGGEVKAKDAYL